LARLSLPLLSPIHSALETTQDVLLTVDSASTNRAPTISSHPRLRSGLQNLYLYLVQATDADGDPLTYTVLSGPDGLTISGFGVVSWQPTPNQLGANSVQIEVSDGRGGVIRQDFVIDVVSQPVNSPPEIISTAPTSGTIGRLFAYDPAAIDPDNDPLFWNLDEAPVGVSVDEQTGAIRWTPAADQRGLHTIGLRVTDPLGGSATQTLTVDVRGTNVPPVFATTPVTRAAVDVLYTYAPRAFDADGDIPTFSLTIAPDGNDHRRRHGVVISWTPTTQQLGLQDVTLLVSDGQGGVTRQLYRILVTTTINRAPAITSTPPLAATLEFEYRYQVSATDPDGDSISFALFGAPAGATIDPASGLLTYVPQTGQEGSQNITVQAQDPLGAVGLQTFTIDVAADNNPPILNGPPLQRVAAGATLSIRHTGQRSGRRPTYLPIGRGSERHGCG